MSQTRSIDANDVEDSSSNDSSSARSSSSSSDRGRLSVSTSSDEEVERSSQKTNETHIEGDRIVSTGASCRAIILVTEEAREQLNPRQLTDFRNHMETFVRWMLTEAKDPQRAKGYAYETTRVRTHIIESFYRYVWREENYTVHPNTDHADEYLTTLLYDEYSDSHLANAQKSLTTLFRFLDVEWDPEVSHTEGRSSRTRPKEFLDTADRRSLREATLEYGTVPSYNNLSASKRSEWKDRLANRFRKPASEITESDFDRANGFKWPSLIWTALDAGLRPIEVGRATTDWVDTEKAVLRIPENESSKNRDNWTVAIKRDTARFLDQWLDERELYDKYENTSLLWLTREDNPYSSRSVNYHFEKLCRVADIDVDDRELSFYAIRHGLGTAMANERGLEAAAEQMRHRSTETTRKYDNTPVNERREALENIG